MTGGAETFAVRPTLAPPAASGYIAAGPGRILARGTPAGGWSMIFSENRVALVRIML